MQVNLCVCVWVCVGMCMWWRVGMRNLKKLFYKTSRHITRPPHGYKRTLCDRESKKERATNGKSERERGRDEVRESKEEKETRNNNENEVQKRPQEICRETRV